MDFDPDAIPELLESLAQERPAERRPCIEELLVEIGDLSAPEDCDYKRK